ncbi:hypothetical protein [Chryseobacterium shandongense]|uniref:hypothetical protein n=1 Tax=Chryseobacterium shandongense TaxID=1493872 RepID=UPI000F4FEE71|nr:hypothetical protein [Chryseobacterium shandongense]AZA56357.1 hypothetical protein EG350_03750 [Chryseobacterium shandongense]
MIKLVKPLILIIAIYTCGICKGQASQKCPEIKWKNGSEAAKKIMKSDFYYDALDAWSPFGSDTGSDTYYLYCEWRKENPKESVRKFLDGELISFEYPGFDIYLDGSNTERLKTIVSTMRNNYVDLNYIDELVISLAFSQLFLEGRIEPEVKKWAEAAFSREAAFLVFWGDGKDDLKERKEREQRMNQLLTDLRKG